MTHSISPVQPSEYESVLSVWEASVRATHDFISEDDIALFKPLIINDFLPSVPLACVRDDEDRIVGFLGTSDGKIEMLFVEPARFGQGVGKALLNHAIDQLGCTKVDVNEQNPAAVGFYLHMGFVVQSRSPVDSMGKPFPILHLVLGD